MGVGSQPLYPQMQAPMGDIRVIGYEGVTLQEGSLALFKVGQ